MALGVNPWFVDCSQTVPIGTQLPDQTGNADQVLHTNGNDAYWAYVDYNNLLNLPSLNTYTFDSGITNTAGSIALGGALTESAIIQTDSYNLTIRSTNESSRSNEVLLGENLIRLSAYGTDDYLTTGGYSRIQIAYTYVSMLFRTASSDLFKQIVINDSMMEVRDTVDNKGLEYTDDYSTNWTDHSLVTKKWVTDNFGAGSAYTATEPIDITGTVVSLTYSATQFQLSGGDTLAMRFGITGGVAAEGDHTHTGYALTSHSHDDRYYTKTELQTNGFASVHWGNIINKPTTLAGYGITDAAPITHVGTGGTAHETVTLSTDGFMDHESYYGLVRDVLRKAKIILSTSSWTWDFNLGFNAEGTPTGATALTINNVETGDYGTIVVLNPAASYELTLPAGSIQIDGNGNTVQLSGSSGKDLLSFYYNGVNFFWSVTTNYS